MEAQRFMYESKHRHLSLSVPFSMEKCPPDLSERGGVGLDKGLGTPGSKAPTSVPANKVYWNPSSPVR